MFRSSRIVISMVVAFLIIIPLAAQAAQTEIKVLYKGEHTTFGELDMLGIEVHCVTQQTSELRERNVFNINTDVVLCFDSVKEADAYAVETGIISNPSENLEDKSLSSNNLMSSCTSWFAMYNQTGYVGWQNDVCSDQPTYCCTVWSIWEDGIAAMRVFKGTHYTSGSWLIAESHWTLGNGWGGAIRSIDFFN